MSLLTNIISYWKFDGNSNDAVVATHNNGTDTDITYSGTTVLIDSYSESNVNNYQWLRAGNVTGNSQSFTNIISDNLSSCVFYMKKVGTPTGNMVAKLYSHSGVYGTSSIPNTLLATSNVIDVSTLTTSYQLITFTFPTGQNYLMSPNTYYEISCEYSGGDANNYPAVGMTLNGSASGNIAELFGGYWSVTPNYDTCFYVYGTTNGKINQSANFNGTTSKIVLGTPITMPTNLTISAWIKKSDDGAYEMIFGDGNVGSTVYWYLSKNGQKINFAWKSGVSDYRIYETDSNVITDNNWHFVCITQTSTNDPNIYIDGSLVSSSLTSSGGVNTKPTAQGSVFGQLGLNSGNAYLGSIDEVGIWSRALSASEITQLYNFNNGIQYPFNLNQGNMLLML